MLIPFNEPNNRVFYACQAVFVEERNTEASNGGNPTNADFLHGVQSVGVSSDNPSISLLDVGRHQRKFTQYGQQTIEITIDRVLDRHEDTFYKVLPAQYTSYKNSHILNANNFGSKGAKDNNDKTLRNYDITILYGSDRFSRFGAGIGGGQQDANTVMSVSYLNCLVTNISYNISVDGVNESITLTTKNIKYNDDYTTLADYNFPDEYLASAASRGPETAASGILKRQHFDLTKTAPTQYGDSLLPVEVKELFNFDTPVKLGKDEDGPLQILGIQSISINASFDYTTLRDVGMWRGSENNKEHEQNRWSVLNLPIPVTCSFTGTIRQALPYFNYLDSQENRVRNVDNIYTKSLANGKQGNWQEANCPIRIVATGFEKDTVNDQKFVWDLGEKNYLTSIEYTGGDTGGGNVEATLNYTNQYSDFVVTKTAAVKDLTNDGPY